MRSSGAAPPETSRTAPTLPLPAQPGPTRIGHAGRGHRQQLAHFIAHVESHRLGTAFYLAATTGMRRGEVLGLRWRDVDLDVGRLAVRQTVVAPANQIQFSTPKTAKGIRSIALDGGTVEALRAHRRRQAQERLAFGPDYADNSLVFCQPDGMPMQPNAFTKTFDRLVASSRLPGSGCTTFGTPMPASASPRTSTRR